MSFQKKLLVSVASLLLVALFLLSVLAGVMLQREVERSIVSEVSQTLSLVRTTASAWVASKSTVMQAVAKALSKHPEDWEPFLTLARDAGDFDLVYVGTGQGGMYQSYPPEGLPDGYDPRVRPWYQEAKQTQALIITAPYVDAFTGAMIISLALPTQASGGNIVGSDIAITGVVEALLSIATRWNSQLWMLDNQGNILATPAGEYLNEAMSDVVPGFSLPEQNELTRITFSENDWIAASVSIPEAGWQFVLFVDAKEARAGLSNLIWRLGIVSVIIILLSSIMLYTLVNYLTKPLKRLDHALDNISSGEATLDYRLEVNTHDEFGRMNQTFNRFLERLQVLLQQVMSLTDTLNEEAEAEREMAMHNQQQLAKLQMEISQLASALRQVSTATSEIAGNADETAAQANEAVHATTRGRDVVDSNRDNVTELAEQLAIGMHNLGQVDEHVQSITTILTTIQGVAEQTNLLALNAAIEAARAGDQGRGFAVVADEVHALSKRTQKATEEIRQMIEALQVSTMQAVNTMQRCHDQANETVNGIIHATERLDIIDKTNRHISDMAMQIASAVEEQNAVTSEISGNTEKIKNVCEELLQQAEDAQARSAKLHHIIVTMPKLSNTLRLSSS